MAHRSHSSTSLRLVSTKALFVGAEQEALVQHDGAAALGRELAEDVLHEQHLRGAGLEGEVLLRVLAFLAAEGRVGQDHVERASAPCRTARRRLARLVSVLPCQRFGWSMPCSTRLASAMGKTRFSFSRPKKVSCFSVSMSVLAGALPELAGDVLVGHGEKAAGAAAGVVDRFAQLAGRPCAPWRGSPRAG